MKQFFLNLLCALLDHKRDYIEFGSTKIPYACKRCGRMWSNW